MTRLAASEDARFTVSTLEVERDGPSYTSETLERLAEERGDTELVFVMGADAAVGLESWHRPETGGRAGATRGGAAGRGLGR